MEYYEGESILKGYKVLGFLVKLFQGLLWNFENCSQIVFEVQICSLYFEAYVWKKVKNIKKIKNSCHSHFSIDIKRT